MIRMLKPILVGLAACAFAAGALAQAYPARPLRLVVPYPPGQGTDVVSRLIAQKLSGSLGQQIIVDNRPGAGGNIGADMVAKAAPDGHTLVMGTNATHAANAAMYPTMPYDHMEDFVPVALVGLLPMVLSANPSFEASSVKELVGLAKAGPGALSVAVPSSSARVVLELFRQLSSADLFAVDYRGSGAAFTDVLGGRVPLTIDTLAASAGHLSAGRLKAIALSTAGRSESAPGIATFAEAGLEGFDLAPWNALFAPRGTPAKIVARLNTGVAEAISDAQVRARLLQLGVEPAPSGFSPEKLAAFVRSETRKWGELVRSAGIKVQ